ncbi:hypothetical protein T265_04566 [Opisthorchis viverrini]|uniref:Uncharacterized protein n=1 Tax=Opisthorchis viverrini TaxID=6198 RepID=A0A074ZS01_OPIVI|nr:hypothetical protein T265_04566 [Opisthorchis viverrini]KER28612.1 hypothetical protein T265_04566 [Opisthorchis viverrini]
MEPSNLPTLFWELVERRLRSSDHYEARLLVGNDLIEQTYELKTEIASFIALMKDGRVINQAFQVSFPKFSHVAGIESHLDKFICFYQKEHHFHSEKGTDDDDDSPCVTEDSFSILSETRQGLRLPDEPEKGRKRSWAVNEFSATLVVLQEEVKALMEYLNKLQESLLVNFAHPAEPEGDCALGKSKEAPVLVIQHGDCKAEHREIRKERKSKRRTSRTAGQAVEVSSASSISNSSANSSASVSPRSVVDVKLKTPSTPSSISADSDISASYRHRTKETLSASSRTLCQNGSPGLSPRTRRQLNVLHQAALCFSCYDIRDIAIHVYLCNVLLIWLLIIRRQPTNGFALFGAHQSTTDLSDRHLKLRSLLPNRCMNRLIAVPRPYTQMKSHNTTSGSTRQMNYRSELSRFHILQYRAYQHETQSNHMFKQKRKLWKTWLIPGIPNHTANSTHNKAYQVLSKIRLNILGTNSNRPPLLPGNVAMNSLLYLDGKLHLIRMICATGDLANDSDIPLGI